MSIEKVGSKNYRKDTRHSQKISKKIYANKYMGNILPLI